MMENNGADDAHDDAHDEEDEKAPVTDGIDEDDGDEDARDKKLTPLSSRRRCHQCASPPFENFNISNLNLQI